MIVYARIKKLMKRGEIYKESVREKRYYQSTQVVETARSVDITFKEQVGRDLVTTKETINKKDLVGLIIVGE